MNETPAIDLLRELLAAQRQAIEQAAPGAREGADPEELHRLRVATRRSRALIRASRPLLGEQLAPLDRELRWLGTVSGPTRDLDVLIEHVRELSGELDPDRAGAASLLAALERERLVQRETLVRALDGTRFRRLLSRYGNVLPTLASANGAVDLSQLAAHELGRLRSAYRRLGDEPSDAALHRLRIKAKRARYAAELASQRDGRSVARLAGALAELQDLTGAHQDAVVAERRLRALASPDSALAVGRIVEYEHTRRRRARARLGKAWKRIGRVAARAF